MIPAIAFLMPVVTIAPTGNMKGWVSVSSFPTVLTCATPQAVVAQVGQVFSYAVVVSDKDEYAMKQNGKWKTLEMPNFLTDCQVLKVRSGKLLAIVLCAMDANTGSKTYTVTVKANSKPGDYRDTFRAVDRASGKLHDKSSEVVACSVQIVG